MLFPVSQPLALSLPLAESGLVMGIAMLIGGVLLTILSNIKKKHELPQRSDSAPRNDTTDLDARIRERQTIRRLRRQLFQQRREVERQIRRHHQMSRPVPQELVQELRHIAATLNRLEDPNVSLDSLMEPPRQPEVVRDRQPSRPEPTRQRREPQARPTPQPQPKPAPRQRPTPRPQAQPQARPQAQPAVSPALLASATSGQQTASITTTEIGAATEPSTRRARSGRTKADRLRHLLRRRESVQAIFVASELLGPPVALRESTRGSVM